MLIMINSVVLATVTQVLSRNPSCHVWVIESKSYLPTVTLHYFNSTTRCHARDQHTSTLAVVGTKDYFWLIPMHASTVIVVRSVPHGITVL